MEVVVDLNAGTVAQGRGITSGGDLVAVRVQRAAMVRAKRSLADATTAAVKIDVGYRAVTAVPSLNGGRPVAEVTLVRGNDRKVVSEGLD